jgi:Cu(I)/Ag(I) efflux system membrane fusion protein
MGVVRWAIVAVMAAVAVGAVLHGRWAASPHESHGVSAAAPVTTLYRCPMHPSVVRDRPGECPICGMTLVAFNPAAEGAATREGGSGSDVPGLAPIDLPADRVQLTGLRTAPVARRPLRGAVTAVGVVTASEKGQATITTRFAGWIEELRVAETGRKVRRGDVLATIYSPDVLRAEQEFLTARRWWGDGAAAPGAAHPAAIEGADLAADARKRLELLGLAEPEIAELARTGKAMRAVAIRAPVSGTVVRKAVVAGAYVAAGVELFAVADLSTVWVLAEVPESQVGHIRAGQAARLELAAYPGETFPARVQLLYPTVDGETRTLRVRLELRNPSGKLRPGLYATVRLDLPAQAGLVVPAEAVVDTGDLQYVFVAKGAGRFEPRRVKVGARAGDDVELVDGVREGETVVTTANFLIDSESRLRAAIEGHAGPAGR